MKTIEEQIAVMQHYAKGGEVEFYAVVPCEWRHIHDPVWDWSTYNYRKKEYQYPIWFKTVNSQSAIVKFTGLTNGEVISGDLGWISKGSNSNSFTAHTDKKVWQQIEEPKKTVTIEKWLVFIAEEEEYKTIETSNIDSYRNTSYQVIKLLETYEVEL